MKDKRSGTVYEIRHLSGYVYIGQTINTKFSRWSQHEAKLNNGCHPSVKFQELWNTSDVEDWQWAVLESNIPADLLNAREYYHHEMNGSMVLNEATPTAIKQETYSNVARDIKAGELTYREISAKHNISLGTVTNIKRIYV